MANRASPAAPSPSAASATTPRSPASITARRTSAAGNPAALATASTITPSSAPWRSSPTSSRTRKSCSPSVARPNTFLSSRNRSPAAPFPRIASSRWNAASTSASVSVASAAAGSARASRSWANPIPIRPCRGTPVNNPTATRASCAPACRRASARCPILTSRPPASATRPEASAILLSRMPMFTFISSLPEAPACPNRPPWRAFDGWLLTPPKQIPINVASEIELDLCGNWG